MGEAATDGPGLHVPANPTASAWRSPLVRAHLLAATAPLQALAALNLFSLRAARHLGRWPRPLLDDPKFIGPGDGLMGALYALSGWMIAWGVVSLAVFPVLLIIAWKRYSRPARWGVTALYVGSLVLFRLDPGDRLAWFAD